MNLFERYFRRRSETIEPPTVQLDLTWSEALELKIVLEKLEKGELIGYKNYKLKGKIFKCFEDIDRKVKEFEKLAGI